jgi:hypothetical protein
MTRDEVLDVVNEVFGARAFASEGYWNVCIETVPMREIVFSSAFVKANVDIDGMTRDELRQMLLDIPESRWSQTQGGGLTTYVR